ncbi:MAG: MarR family winged helix-turn-helix transcriptional regulator [Flavisolibacter sp.]
MADNLDLAREFGKAISEMRHHMRRYLQAKIREEGLDISFELLELMGILWQKDGVNQQELADIIVKDKSSMVYLIDNLIKRKLVVRKEDENDRRNKLIYLTREGKQLQKKLNPSILDMYSKATKGMTSTDLKKAIAVVQKIKEGLQQ